MHALFKLELDKLSNNEFFAVYLGAQVIEKLEASSINFRSWDDDTRTLFRAICTFYAEHMPQADHVIRRDVGGHGTFPANIKGNLLMYFGVQAPTRGTRSHFVGVKYDATNGSFNLFIGGSPDANNRQAYVHEEDINHRVEGLKIVSVDQLNSNLLLVTKTQNPRIQSAKTLGEQGFIPSDCTAMWDKEARRPDAGNIYYNYWTQFIAVADLGMKLRVRTDLMSDSGKRKDLVISLIAQYVDPAEAFKRVLGYEVLAPYTVTV